MTARDLRLALDFYLNRDSFPEIKLHVVEKECHIEDWNAPEKKITIKEAKKIYDENIIDYEKKRKVQIIKLNAYNKIIEKYPIWKQICINNLQGYIEIEKNNMWEYINDIRNQSNQLELELNDIDNVEDVKDFKIEFK